MARFAVLAFATACFLLGGLLLVQEYRRQLPEEIPLAAIDEPRNESASPVSEPPPAAVQESAALPSTAPVSRLRIDAIGVDAPVVTLGVDAEGVMEAPAAPLEVAWYDFSPRPGWGSNAVFAGHVDFRNFGPAVFWKLRQVRQGDRVQVSLEDGTTYDYHVVSVNLFSADDAPVEAIIGPSGTESLTLITCDGTFNTRTRQYDQRLIVRADRVWYDN